MRLMFIIKTGILLSMAVCLSCCSGHKPAKNELWCHVMEVEGGYGYIVCCGTDTLIYQPFIPAISGRKPFATKKQALEVAKLVCDKMAEGEMPSLTCEEVEACIAKFSD